MRSIPVSRLGAVRFYLLAELLLTFSQSVTFLVSAVYLVRVVHMTPLELVLTGTVMEAAIFLFEIPTGVVADIYSRRLSVTIGWLVMGGSFVLIGAVSSVPVILAGWALWGFGYTFTSGAWEAWLTDEVGVDAVGPVLLRGTRLALAGSLAGIAVSVTLAGQVGLGFAVATGGALNAVLGVLAIFLMPEQGFRRPVRDELSRRRQLATTALRGGRLIRGRPLLLLILGISFFVGMSTEAFDRLTEAHFIRDVGLPSIGSLDPVYWFGIFSVVGMGLGLAATTLLIPRVKGAGHAVLARTLLALTAAQLIGAVAFALSGNLAAAIVPFYVYRLTRRLIAPLETTWLNQNIPDSSVRATVLSMTGQADAIGQVAGGPAIGAIGTLVSLPAALLVGAGVLLPALGLYTRALRHDGHEPGLEELPQAVETGA